jgi:hypothetical protein
MIDSDNNKNNESFNLYEVGVSDPNLLKPREFKHLYNKVPLDISVNAYEKLAALTAL